MNNVTPILSLSSF